MFRELKSAKKVILFALLIIVNAIIIGRGISTAQELTEEDSLFGTHLEVVENFKT